MFSHFQISEFGVWAAKRQENNMAHKVKQEVVLALPPDKAWEAVKDLQNINWLADARVMATGKGVEELVLAWESRSEERVLECTIGSTSLPVTNYSGRLSVTPVGRSRSRVSFACTFDSPDKDMKALFAQLYDESLNRIKVSCEG
jgi:hypothetical protein